MSSIQQTVFTRASRDLGDQLRECLVDHVAFEKKLSICDLQVCKATCCHDGVILGKEEASILGGLSTPDWIEFLGGTRWKVRTQDANLEELDKQFPVHFKRTRCVYLDSENRCQWQLRSIKEGRHPWYYKPISCWMHPINLVRRKDRLVLTIFDEKEDTDNFSSQTPCGRTCSLGQRAGDVLEKELKMLSHISGRDFYSEVNAPTYDG